MNGRDELTIDAKAKLDGEYVNRMGSLFDAKRLLRTVVGHRSPQKRPVKPARTETLDMAELLPGAFREVV